MQTLNRRTLKLTAQMAPVGNASRTVYLEIEEDGVWNRIGESTYGSLTLGLPLSKWRIGTTHAMCLTG